MNESRYGHCSLAHPSLETAKIARSYFLEGVVPEWGTTTDADEGFLFPHPSSNEVVRVEGKGEDDELKMALNVLASEIGRKWN